MCVCGGGGGGGGRSTEAAADTGLCDTKTQELCESRGGRPFNFVRAWILLTQLNTQSACQHSSVQDGVYAFEKSRMRSVSTLVRFTMTTTSCPFGI